MYGVIYVRTKQNVNDYSQKIKEYFGAGEHPRQVYGRTSLNYDYNDSYDPEYFYGKSSIAMNLLFSRHNSKTLRVFCEGKSLKGNISLLTKNLNELHSEFRSFSKTHNVCIKLISLQLYSEKEEVLTGSVTTLWTRMIEKVTILPATIYIAILTIVFISISRYSHDSEENIAVSAFTKLIIVLVAVFIWLFINSWKNPGIKFETKR
jgi:hypothetical protein